MNIYTLIKSGGLILLGSTLLPLLPATTKADGDLPSYEAVSQYYATQSGRSSNNTDTGSAIVSNEVPARSNYRIGAIAKRKTASQHIAKHSQKTKKPSAVSMR